MEPLCVTKRTVGAWTHWQNAIFKLLEIPSHLTLYDPNPPPHHPTHPPGNKRCFVNNYWRDLLCPALPGRGEPPPHTLRHKTTNSFRVQRARLTPHHTPSVPPAPAVFATVRAKSNLLSGNPEGEGLLFGKGWALQEICTILCRKLAQCATKKTTHDTHSTRRDRRGPTHNTHMPQEETGGAHTRHAYATGRDRWGPAPRRWRGPARSPQGRT